MVMNLSAWGFLPNASERFNPDFTALKKISYQGTEKFFGELLGAFPFDCDGV
jgi:hypothetical protein